MGLFSKETCEFCGKEVGALKRSKLATKEYICNDCRKKVNYFARMDYTSKENAQIMMDVLRQDEEDFEKSFDAAEGRFARAERSYRTWDLGSKRVQYRCNTSLGAFQLLLDDMSHYEHVPVFWFSRMMPYEFQSNDAMFADMRRSKMMDEDAEYVEVKEEKGDDGKVKRCTLVIPYDDICIREVRIESDISNENEAEAFHSLADEINGDRKVWLSKSEFDLEQKNKMQVRNLGDTAAEALKTAIKGGDVADVLKKGVETANEIEEGKVKRGFFGKLFKK